VKISWQVRLLLPWTRLLTAGDCFYFLVVRLVVTGGSLTRSPKDNLT